MSRSTLEQRLTSVELEIAALREKTGSGTPGRGWWHRLGGSFADDPIFEQAMRYGAAYRKSLRPASGRRKARGAR